MSSSLAINDINRGNARQIYYDICHGKYEGITKDSPEADRCCEFLSQDQIEYCEKDEGNEKVNGRDSIDRDGMKDYGKTDENGDVTTDGSTNKGMTISSTVGSGLASAATGLQILAPNFIEDILGCGGVIISIITLALSALCCTGAFAMDSAYTERGTQAESTEANSEVIKGAKQEADDANAQIEATKNSYVDAQNEKTAACTENINTISGLEIELQDAQASGDAGRAKELEATLAELSEGPDTSPMDEAMDNARYAVNLGSLTGANGEGTYEAGRSVGLFLQEAKPFATAGKVNGALCGLAAVGSLLCAQSQLAFVPLPWALCLKTSAMIMFGIAAAAFGVAAATYFVKGGNEAKYAECGDTTCNDSDELKTSVDTLGASVGEADGMFEESDQAAAETMVQIEDSAEASTNENNGTHPTVVTTPETPEGNS